MSITAVVTNLESQVFQPIAGAGRVLRVVWHPRHLRAAAVHEDVLLARVTMIITVHLQTKAEH
jgi:hypothetical protein